MSTNAIFKIHHDEQTIDLLSPQWGYHIDEWEPAVATYKEGGVRADSALVDNSYLVAKRWQNVSESLSLKINRVSADALAQSLAELHEILEEASNYWIDGWRRHPVYIEARAAGESNTRYALLYSGRLVGIPNPYAQPFLQPQGAAVADELELLLERGHWLSQPPGETECMPILEAKVDDDAHDQFIARVLNHHSAPTMFWPLDEESGTTAEELIAGADGEYLGIADPGGVRFLDGGPAPDLPSGPLEDTSDSGFVNLSPAATQSIFQANWNTTKGTVMFWFRFNDATAWTDEENHIIAVLGGGTGSHIIVEKLSTSPSKLLLDMGVGGATFDLDGQAGTNWINVYVSWDSGVSVPFASLYVNGTPIDASGTNWGRFQIDYNRIQGTPTTNILGANSVIGTWGIEGQVTRLIYWDRVIPFGRIQSLFLAPPLVHISQNIAGTTCERGFASSNWTNAVVTHAFVYDASAATYSSNLLEGALPADLLPSDPDAGDILYVGSEVQAIDDLATRGAFSNLAFNLEGVAGFSGQIVWEYRVGGVGATWAELPNAMDDTDGFSRDGRAAVAWEIPDDWDPQYTVNGVSGFWVRARVDADPNSVAEAPQQVETPIRTVNHPFIDVVGEIDSAQDIDIDDPTQAERLIINNGVGGDLPALGRLSIIDLLRSDTTFSGLETLYVAGRSLKRGASFSAYLNASQTALPPGVSCSGGNNTSFLFDKGLPGYAYLSFSPPSDSSAYQDVITWRIGSALSEEYGGTYRAIVEWEQIQGTHQRGDLNVRLSYSTDTQNSITLNPVQPPDGDLAAFLELGTVTIPHNSMNSIRLTVQMAPIDAASGVTANIHAIYRLFLVPVDEWCVQAQYGDFPGLGVIGSTLDVDSTGVHDARRRVSVVEHNTLQGSVAPGSRGFSSRALVGSIYTAPITFGHDGGTRIWFFPFPQVKVPGNRDPKDLLLDVTCTGVKRYLSLRGSR